MDSSVVQELVNGLLTLFFLPLPFLLLMFIFRKFVIFD